MKPMKMQSIDMRKIKSLFNSRNLMMCAMVAVLVATGVLSLKYTRMTQQAQAAAQNDVIEVSAQTPGYEAQNELPKEEIESMTQEESVSTFFSDYRSDRNAVRAQEVAYLDSIIQNTATQSDVRNEAQERKIELTDMMEKEVTVEGLLRAKGFTQAIVTLSQGGINVVVGDAQLTESQAAQILEVVQSETGEKTQNVKIIPAG